MIIIMIILASQGAPFDLYFDMLNVCYGALYGLIACPVLALPVSLLIVALVSAAFRRCATTKVIVNMITFGSPIAAFIFLTMIIVLFAINTGPNSTIFVRECLTLYSGKTHVLTLAIQIMIVIWTMVMLTFLHAGLRISRLFMTAFGQRDKALEENCQSA